MKSSENEDQEKKRIGRGSLGTSTEILRLQTEAGLWRSFEEDHVLYNNFGGIGCQVSYQQPGQLLRFHHE